MSDLYALVRRLRAVADNLEVIAGQPDPLPEFGLHDDLPVSLHVPDSFGPEADRIAVVDRINTALGCTSQFLHGSYGSWHAGVHAWCDAPVSAARALLAESDGVSA